MTHLTTSPSAPELRTVAVRLASAGPALWRVLDPTGRVLGHLQAIPGPQGVRYRARRFHAAARAFLDLGDFWSAEDAVETLRYAH